MKFTPITISAVYLLASASAIAIAVAIAKQNARESRSDILTLSYTPEEWERFKHWPAGFTEPTEAITEVLTIIKVDDNPESETSNTENIVSTNASITENTTPIVIGDGPGEIKPFSEEYKQIVDVANEAAQKNDSYILNLSGKTYGLGARGHKSEDAENTTEYNASDIAKLHKKAHS